MKQMKTIDGLTGMNIGYDDTTYTKLGKLQNVLRTSVRNFFAFYRYHCCYYYT